jgi:hypothetical protein
MATPVLWSATDVGTGIIASRGKNSPRRQPNPEFLQQNQCVYCRTAKDFSRLAFFQPARKGATAGARRSAAGSSRARRHWNGSLSTKASDDRASPRLGKRKRWSAPGNGCARRPPSKRRKPGGQKPHSISLAFKKRSAASRRQHKVRRDKKRTMAMLRYFNRPAPDSTPEFIQFEGRERIRAENELRRRAYYRKQKEAMKP